MDLRRLQRIEENCIRTWLYHKDLDKGFFSVRIKSCSDSLHVNQRGHFTLWFFINHSRRQLATSHSNFASLLYCGQYTVYATEVDADVHLRLIVNHVGDDTIISHISDNWRSLIINSNIHHRKIWSPRLLCLVRV